MAQGAAQGEGQGRRKRHQHQHPLSAKPKGKQIAATYENCLSGDYPLARFLYVYVNKKPGAAMDTLTAE